MRWSMDIRLVTSEQEKQLVYQFRYQIYIEEMNRKQKYCNHDTKSIQEPLDKTGRILAAFNDSGQIIGTVRLNYAREGNLGYYPTLYNMQELGLDYLNSSITTKLMVEKNYRRTTAVRSLLFAAYKQAITDNIRYDFIDVNSHLVKFFRRFGYTSVSIINHPEYGHVTLMRAKFDDAEYLHAVKSPLYPILANHLGYIHMNKMAA